MSTRDKFIALSQSQVGYKETGSNNTKYAKYFDTEAWQWFNTKKQGAAWCAIYICYLVCQIIGNTEALSFLGCPAPKNNCAAGVPYLWKYFKAKGYTVDKSKGVAGDIIFLNSNKHVGMIEKVSDGKYHTIEGNKSNAVKRGSYKIGSSSIYGIAHLPFEKYDTVDPEPTPEPTPTPTPAPTTQDYKVKTNGSCLALRVAPNTKATLILWMPNGSKVTVSGQQDGWMRTTYKGRTGWSYGKWLKKV